jgi:CRISPR-associated endonuclease/helicase Cas3
MIDQIGGQFMIMTATLPQIYIEYLAEKGITTDENVAQGEFLNDTVRHRINVKEKAILDDTEAMIQRGKDNKVLVIVNTVGRAIEVFEHLDQSSYQVDVNLLHSMFIKRDRGLLEKRIKEFADTEGENGIWVTTQLVEASLDIDFDYLFTELSTLDSLFQRLGRCYRKRVFDLAEPNIYIYTEGVKGIGYIYDQEVWEMSKEEIIKYNGMKLTEEDKVEMVEQLYSKNNLAGTQFWEDFNNALDYLDNIEPYEKTKGEAQRILREINNVNVIPREIYDQIRADLIEKYRAERDRDKLRELRREINKYTVSIQWYKAKDRVSSIYGSQTKKLSDTYILNRNYDFNQEDLSGRGVMLEEELSNML